MPEPEAYNSYVFEVQDERHLPQVIDAFRHLALQGIVTTKLHMINDFVSLTVVMQRIDQSRSDRRLPETRRDCRLATSSTEFPR